jgi:signal-transduction protein with cAMP-binding, CBS, and nucleotidyltransferase domain
MQLPAELDRLTVRNALRRTVVTITTDQTLEEAARMMRDRGVTALAVIDVDSRDPGIITEADIGRAMAAEDDPRKHHVREYLTADVIAATSDWTLDRAARTMAAGHIRHLMVVEEHKVVGILSMRDIVSAWAHASDALTSTVPEETGELPTLGPAHEYLYSLRRSAKQHLVAAKCPCEWEWYEILQGQLEDRPDLDRNTLEHLWERRDPCPALHAEGGGAD